MKKLQFSEAESTPNHPVFSAPGLSPLLTRHQAACCSRHVLCCCSGIYAFKSELAFQIFAFKLAIPLSAVDGRSRRGE
jgi:hypothetical protein